MFYCSICAIFAIMGKKVVTVDETVNKDIVLRVRITPYIDNELTRMADRWECNRSELARVVLTNFVNEMAGDEGEG